jgi:hypothetical protein
MYRLARVIHTHTHTHTHNSTWSFCQKKIGNKKKRGTEKKEAKKRGTGAVAVESKYRSKQCSFLFFATKTTTGGSVQRL